MPDIAALVQDHGYWVLALVVMLENAGLPVPGETALLAAGYLTSPDGGQYLHLWAVVPVAFFAAIVGDNFGFLLGAGSARPRLAAGKTVSVPDARSHEGRGAILHEVRREDRVLRPVRYGLAGGGRTGRRGVGHAVGSVPAGERGGRPVLGRGSSLAPSGITPGTRGKQ